MWPLESSSWSWFGEFNAIIIVGLVLLSGRYRWHHRLDVVLRFGPHCWYTLPMCKIGVNHLINLCRLYIFRNERIPIWICDQRCNALHCPNEWANAKRRVSTRNFRAHSELLMRYVAAAANGCGGDGCDGADTALLLLWILNNNTIYTNATANKILRIAFVPTARCAATHHRQTRARTLG